MWSDREWELEEQITGGYGETDSSLAFADPRESYAVIDSVGGTLFTPYDLVRIVRCPTCQEDYVNRTFLNEHIARVHVVEESSASTSVRASRKEASTPTPAPEPKQKQPRQSPRPNRHSSTGRSRPRRSS